MASGAEFFQTEFSGEGPEVSGSPAGRDAHGVRVQQEGLTLLKTDVNLVARLITIRAEVAKNKTSRIVAINDTLYGPLKTLMESNDSPWVFAKADRTRRKSFRTAFENARSRAKLPNDITPHVLRHNFATNLVEAGVDLRTVQALGGWGSLAMVVRYTHPRETPQDRGRPEAGDFEEFPFDFPCGRIRPRGRSAGNG